MKTRSTVGTLLFVSISAALILGCAAKKKEDASTGTGSVFTISDVAKAWTGTCVSKTDATLVTTQSKISLTLNSGGTFSFSEAVYAAPSFGSPCAGADYKAVFSVSGTFTVGSTVTGGQALTFTTNTSPTLMVLGGTYTATQNIFNNDCGGTSPYCTLSGTCSNNGKADGAAQNSSNMLCQHFTFPGTSTTMYNVGSWDGTILTIGANTLGSPGVFSVGSRATSATISLY